MYKSKREQKEQLVKGLLGVGMVLFTLAITGVGIANQVMHWY